MIATIRSAGSTLETDDFELAKSYCRDSLKSGRKTTINNTEVKDSRHLTALLKDLKKEAISPVPEVEIWVDEGGRTHAEYQNRIRS